MHPEIPQIRENFIEHRKTIRAHLIPGVHKTPQVFPLVSDTLKNGRKA